LNERVYELHNVWVGGLSSSQKTDNKLTHMHFNKSVAAVGQHYKEFLVINC
jgi:hypothetical protein